MEEFLYPSQKDKEKFRLLKFLFILCGLALFIAQKYWFSYIDSLPICERLPYLKASLYVALLIGALIPLWLLRFFMLAIRHQQVPPPGSLIVGRTKLLIGRQAIIRGRSGVALSGLVLIAAIGFTFI